jgi:hypothetical protein
LLAALDRRAERQRARGGGFILDQEDFQPEHPKHGFQCDRPHPLVLAAGLTAILAEQFSGISDLQSAEPVYLQARKLELVDAQNSGVTR